MTQIITNFYFDKKIKNFQKTLDKVKIFIV